LSIWISAVELMPLNPAGKRGDGLQRPSAFPRPAS
jgi:hypothetical protein